MQRKSGIELLRLFAVVGIVILHLCGSIQTTLSGFNMYVNIFLKGLCSLGVTCFILISGYFGLKVNCKKLIKMELMLLFWGIVSYFLSIADGAQFSKKEFVLLFFPVLSRKYWFITCYFVLIMISPFLNILIEKIDRKTFFKMILILLVIFDVFCIIPEFWVTADGGKGIVQFVIIYFIGRYIRLYKDEGTVARSVLKMGVVMMAITFLGNVGLTLLRGHGITWLAADNSITVIMTAICIFILFKSMTFSNRLINRISSNVLAVCVLEKNYNLYFSSYIDLNRFADEYYMGIVIIGLAILIVLVAVVCEEVRRHTFGYIENLLANALEKLLRKGYDKFFRFMEKFE